MSNDPETILKAPAVVLGCLCPGYVRVIVLPGHGMADGGILHDVPLDLIPFDLRLPNSEFILLLDRAAGRFVGVARLGNDGAMENDEAQDSQ
jgi:hypothetical protein